MRPAQNTSRGGDAESRGARDDGELCCLKKVKIIHCKKSFLFSLTRFHVFMKVPFFYWHFMWKNLKITRPSCALDNQAEKRRETHQAGAGPWLSVNTDGDFSIKVVTHMQTAARNPSHAHRRHRPQVPAVQAARPRPPGGRGQVAGRLGQWAEHPPRRPVKPRAAQGRPPPPAAARAPDALVGARAGALSAQRKALPSAPGGEVLDTGLRLFSHMVSFHTENNPEEHRCPDFSQDKRGDAASPSLRGEAVGGSQDGTHVYKTASSQPPHPPSPHPHRILNNELILYAS